MRKETFFVGLMTFLVGLCALTFPDLAGATKKYDPICEMILNGFRLPDPVPFEISIENRPNSIHIMAHEPGPDDEPLKIFADVEFELRKSPESLIDIKSFSGSLDGKGRDFSAILFGRLLDLFPEYSTIRIELPAEDVPMILQQLSADKKPSEALAHTKTFKLLSGAGFSRVRELEFRNLDGFGLVLDMKLDRKEQELTEE